MAKRASRDDSKTKSTKKATSKKGKPSRRIFAAGAVLWRPAAESDEPLIAVIHRPRYDDWTFPKGKLDEGETASQGARREVLEETGYWCRLGVAVGTVEYTDRADRTKVVHYFEMDVIEGGFVPNREVDEIRWMTIPDALPLLTYERDRAVLRARGRGER